MTASVRLTGDWKKLEHQLSDSVFRAKIKKELKRATHINGGIVKREVRENLRAAGHTAGATLTRFIKGSSKPLVDRGQLFKSISFRTTSPFRGEIGVLKKSPAANLALIVHEGAIIPVTAKMRGLFAVLEDVSEGRREPGSLTGRALELYNRRKSGWRALNPTTRAIRIPARPYIRETVERRDLNHAVALNWLAAAAAAVAGVAPKFKTDV